MKTKSCASTRKTRPFLRKTLNQALAVAGLLGTLFVMPVFADEAADVSKLLKGGNYSEALAKANAALAQKPRDAQMRFLKGVALTEMNKSAEAIAVFARLSEDFPDLPEPHNNLAVLYASNGQFDKARASLDMAMRTNPSYATALENLGDVNARMASQAYDKALQLDNRNASAKSKLTLLTTLGNSSKAASASATASPAAAAPAAKAVASALPAPAAAPVAKVTAPAVAAVAPAPAAKVAVPATPVPPVVAAAPAVKAVAPVAQAAVPAAVPASVPPAPVAVVAKKFVPTGDHGRGSAPTPRPAPTVVANVAASTPATVPAPALAAKPTPAPAPVAVAVTKPVTPPPAVVASVTPAAKPVPVAAPAAPVAVAKPAVTPPVAVATVTPAAKPVQVAPAPAIATKPAPAPVVVATVTPAAKPVQVVPAPAATPAVAAKPVQVVPAPATATATAAKLATAPAIAAAVTPAAKPAQAAPAAKPAEPLSKQAKQAETDKEDIMKAVNGWAKAWSARDVGSYLDYYANDFQTPGGMSRKAWAEERNARIKGKGRISVNIENPQITINDKTATVVFRQVYVSDRLRANGRKTLLLVKQGGKWQIKQERAGS